MSASTAIDRRLLRAAAAILLVLCALVGPHAGALAQAPTGNENWDDRFVAVGANNTITAVVVDGAGNLYAGGTFTTIGGVTANRVAKWNGTIWTPLGNGTNGNVSTLALDPSGNLYVGGAFTTAGDVTANRIAMWNGSSWSDLGGGMDNTVSTLAFDRSGNLYAGGSDETRESAVNAGQAYYILVGGWRVPGILVLDRELRQQIRLQCPLGQRF